MSAAIQLIAIAVIAIVGAFVGYHAWQDWLHSPQEEGESHQIEISPIMLSDESSQLGVYSQELIFRPI